MQYALRVTNYAILFMMNNSQIWQAVLGEIELSLSKANFVTWFKQTAISSLIKDQLIISVPNSFTKIWLEKKYDTQIKNAIQNITNQEITSITYKIETNNNNNSIAPVLKKINNKVLTNRFGLNARYTFNNFIVGKNNELANAACQAVATNPGKAYNPLLIYGGVGLGKTHLLQAIGNEIGNQTEKILYVTSEKFVNEYIQAIRNGKSKDFKDKYRQLDLLLIDDVQFMGGKDGSQEEFFHTFNELHQKDKQIVLTSDKAPQSIPAMENRLSSRLSSGMVVDISHPNIETRLAILNKKCQEKNYFLKNDVSDYIANNIKNNIRELEGALNKIIVFHEFNNTIPSVSSVKNILTDFITKDQLKPLSIKEIISTVANFYDIDQKDLVGKERKKELVWARQVAIYIIRTELNTSYPTIGRELGGRDHTTAIHAFTKIKKEIAKDKKTKKEIESIMQILKK